MRRVKSWSVGKKIMTSLVFSGISPVIREVSSMEKFAPWKDQSAEKGRRLGQSDDRSRGNAPTEHPWKLQQRLSHNGKCFSVIAAHVAVQTLPQIKWKGPTPQQSLPLPILNYNEKEWSSSGRLDGHFWDVRGLWLPSKYICRLHNHMPSSCKP